MIHTYYDRSLRLWVAYLTDGNTNPLTKTDDNQIGECEYHPNKDLAIFNLGVEHGFECGRQQVAKRLEIAS